METLDFDNIGVAGDWHGNTLWALMALERYHEEGVQTILHAGDFGFWPGEKGQSYLTKIHSSLVEYNQVLMVTLGNHEDYVQVETFTPHPTMPGFVYDASRPRIMVATRGVRWEWNGVTFVSLGGAASIDFERRTKGVDWWTEERISLGDVYNTVSGGHADVMIGHDCATGIRFLGSHREDRGAWSKAALDYADQSRLMMRQAVDGVKPDVFFHGHYHTYLDEQVTFNDGLTDYSYRNVGLGKDEQANNMAVLSLPSLNVRMLKMLGE